MKTEAKTYPEFSKEAIAKRAAFQRHAVRCHHDLVAALEALLIRLDYKTNQGCFPEEMVKDVITVPMIKQARAALARAKEVEAAK